MVSASLVLHGGVRWLRKKGTYGVKEKDIGICQNRTSLGRFNQGEELVGEEEILLCPFKFYLLINN